MAAIEGCSSISSSRRTRRRRAEIVLDLDATDDPLHGHQEGRFFHGYYDCYCYLPLYVFCGGTCSRPSSGARTSMRRRRREKSRIVAQIRARWPRVEILLRADFGFAREALMSWCEANRVDYVFGLARNERLVGAIAADLALAEAESLAQGGAAVASPTSPGARSTAGAARGAWSPRPSTCPRARTRASSSPRSPLTQIDARTLYEDIYCARGEVENRIKEQQLDLFADRTSAATMRANQLRLWFASFAYVLLDALRRIGLAPHPVRQPPPAAPSGSSS